MACALAHPLANVLLDSFSPAALVEERDVLFPAEADHHTKSVLEGNVEQPSRRDCVGADGVRSHARDAREIGRYCFRIVIQASVGAWREGSIRDASDEKLFVADKNEL